MVEEQTMRKFKYITLDVWDTMIRRRCHPDSVKLHVSRYIILKYIEFLKPEYSDEMALLKARQECEYKIGKQYEELGFDLEYELCEVYQQWILQIFDILPNSEQLIKELREIELSQEFHVTYKDPGIEKTLSNFDDIEKIFISDFYMSRQDIEKILNDNGLGSIVRRGYSSCDVRYNKRSGRLYSFVLEAEGIDHCDVFHIGDNEHSDVKSPISLGIKAQHYLPKAEHDKRTENEKLFLKYDEVIDRSLNDLFLQKNQELKGYKQKIFNAGIQFSSLPVGFVLYVMEQAIKLRHEKVYFFTREGELFKEIYDSLADINPFGVELPKAELLEVSRISTFAASLHDCSIQSMMRIWSLYSTQSLGALFSSLGVSSQQYESLVSRHSLSLTEDIIYPWMDSRVTALFDDPEFQVKLANHLDLKRTTLLKYLSEKGFPVTGRIAVVDIGWRGTIQDNLAHLLPDVHFDGFYLGLDKFLNPQPKNVSKYAFCVDMNEDHSRNQDLFHKVAPIEMLFNSPNGSVINYECPNSASSVGRHIDKRENQVFYDYVQYFQLGVMRAAAVIGEAVRCHVVPVQTLRQLATRSWIDICSHPNPEIAAAFFKLRHNETFGVGKFDDKSSQIPVKVWLEAMTSVGGFKKLVRYLESTGWPEGYLSQRRLGFFWQFILSLRNIRRRSFRNINDSN